MWAVYTELVDYFRQTPSQQSEKLIGKKTVGTSSTV